MSDTPRGADPDEPTIQRPRLFASGERRPDQEPEAERAADARHVAEAEHAAEAGHTETSGHAAEAGHAETSGLATEPGDAAAPTSPAPAAARQAGQAGQAGQATAGQAASAGRDDSGGKPTLVVGPADETQARRRRRFTIIGIAAGAAVIVIALCAGGLGVVSAIHGARGNAADVREARRQRDADCLELETRLNHLIPPGATTTPAARATAVQDENAAVRIYVARLGGQRDADAWRQLLDARTTFADALQQQAKTRTPAFFVAPRAGDGQALADQLGQLSPASCAGAVRRLAAPDL